jgi:E-phenylitaconyl-CoA hydratase
MTATRDGDHHEGSAGGPDGLRIERRGAVALLTIDRPASRNALTLAAHSELVHAWASLQDDGDVRVMVITGAQDPSLPPEKQSFCAGADVAELRAGLPAEDVPSLAALDGPTPVIAAVNGYCIGAGLTMLLAAHLRVASPTATFGVPELRYGTIPGNGGIRRAMLELPRAVVMELLLRPDRMASARALELGLINAIVPQEQVLATALAWAQEIASLPVEAVRAALTLAAMTPRLAPDDAGRLERRTMRRLHGATATHDA